MTEIATTDQIIPKGSSNIKSLRGSRNTRISAEHRIEAAIPESAAITEHKQSSE